MPAAIVVATALHFQVVKAAMKHATTGARAKHAPALSTKVMQAMVVVFYNKRAKKVIIFPVHQLPPVALASCAAATPIRTRRHTAPPAAKRGVVAMLVRIGWEQAQQQKALAQRAP